MSQAAESGPWSLETGPVPLPAADSRREELAEIVRRIAALRKESDDVVRRLRRAGPEPEPGLEDESASRMPDALARRDLAEIQAELDALVARAGTLVVEISGRSAEEAAEEPARGSTSPHEAGQVQLSPRQRERRLLHRRIVELIDEVDRLEESAERSSYAEGTTETSGGFRPEAGSSVPAAMSERESQLRTLLNHALQLEAAIIESDRPPVPADPTDAPGAGRPSAERLDLPTDDGRAVEAGEPNLYPFADARRDEALTPREIQLPTDLTRGGLSVRIIQPTGREADAAAGRQDLTLVFEGIGQRIPLMVSIPVDEPAAQQTARRPVANSSGLPAPLLAAISIVTLGVSLLMLVMMTALWAAAITPR